MNGLEIENESVSKEIVRPKKWREISEDGKMEHVIKIVDFDEDAGVITGLRLSRIFRPFGNTGNRVELHYDVSCKGSEITITVSKIRYSWGGTEAKTLGVVTVEEKHAEDDPWFIHVDEVDDMVRKLGVAKTSELILDTIKIVIDYYLDWEVE
jgi:predicted RNase H-like HicB family nuclease